MAKKNPNNRRSGRGHFLLLPDELTAHEAYNTLPDSAKALLIEIARQFTGKNNGDLTATKKLLETRGWNSNAKITRGLRKLIDHGFIVQTRQGRRSRLATLYAITWQPINECGGKLEVSPTRVATNEWRQFRFLDPPQKVHTAPFKGVIEGRKVVSLNP